MAFKKATKKQTKLKMAIVAPSGAGKTKTAQYIAKGLGGSVAVIDSEHGSASMYADEFDFDVCDIEDKSPQNYIKMIDEAIEAGYEVLIIDSLSHAWVNLLEQKTELETKNTKLNSFTAWAKMTPIQNQLVEKIVSAPIHIIATIRAKTEYILETNEKGRQSPKKVGIGAVQRDGIEYEFAIVAEMDMEHNLIITKSRISELSDKVFPLPNEKIGKIIKAWTEEGDLPDYQELKKQAVFKSWKCPQDCYDWGMKQLDVDQEEIEEIFKSVDPDEKGNRKYNFYDTVLKLKARAGIPDDAMEADHDTEVLAK